MIPQTPPIAMSAKKENDVRGLCLRERIRHSIFACLALVTVCSLFLLTTLPVEADTVTINDQAGVLDAGRVQAEAAKLPVPMLIYTTDSFTGDQDALNTYTREQLPNQDAIAIGIDTGHRNLSIEAGTNVQLSDSQASDAVSAFRSNYDNGGDYTSATIAALDSVQNALSGGGINPFLLFFGVPVVVILIMIGITYIRNRVSGRPGGIVWGGIHWNSGSSGHGGHGGGGGSSGGGAGGSF
jgi:hypothetical protein